MTSRMSIAVPSSNRASVFGDLSPKRSSVATTNNNTSFSSNARASMMLKLASRKNSLSFNSGLAEELSGEESGRIFATDSADTNALLQEINTLRSQKDSLLLEKKMWLSRLQEDNVKLAIMFKVTKIFLVSNFNNSICLC